MFHAIKSAIQRGARTVALSSAASLLIAVGLAFLTVSAWMALAAVLEPVAVAAILGGAYTGAGLIVLALASRPDPHRRAQAESGPAAPVPADAIVQSFLTGMATGQSAGARR